MGGKRGDGPVGTFQRSNTQPTSGFNMEDEGYVYRRDSSETLSWLTSY